MAGNTKVVEDGTETTADFTSPPGPNWFWVIVGLVVGMGLTVVFFMAGSEEPVVTAESVPTPELDEPAQPDPEAPPSTQAAPEGVAHVVAGFPDTLVAVTQVDSSNLGQLTWPLAGPPRVEQLPGFFSGNAEFDLSGRMLAIGASVRDTGRMILSLGTARRIQPLAANVTGFAWHDSEGGLLAYTQVVAGEWLLSTVGTSRIPDLVVQGLGVDGHVVAWGDWGFAVQDGDEVTLLAEDGEAISVLQGRALDSTDGGRIVLYDGELHIVSMDGSRELLDIDLSGIGEPEVASISPDGSKLAVVGGAGHLIVPIDGDGEVTYAPVTSGFPQLAWSSDSRFLISPWIRGVLFVDTERSAAQPLAALTQHTVVAATAVQLDDG